MAFKTFQGDILSLQCDALINPSDERLSGSMGIDLQLRRKAGKWLAMCCRDLAPIWPGMAVMTEGFNLGCRVIIHTAVPWYVGNPDQLDELRACYRNSLKIAEREGCRNIALPLMGAGYRAFPMDFVEKCAGEEIESFLERNPDCEVTLVLYSQSWDEEDEEAIMNG